MFSMFRRFRRCVDVVAAFRCSSQLAAAFFSGQKLHRRGFELRRRILGLRKAVQQLTCWGFAVREKID